MCRGFFIATAINFVGKVNKCPQIKFLPFDLILEGFEIKTAVIVDIGLFFGVTKHECRC